MNPSNPVDGVGLQTITRQNPVDGAHTIITITINIAMVGKEGTPFMKQIMGVRVAGTQTITRITNTKEATLEPNVARITKNQKIHFPVIIPGMESFRP